MRQDQKPIQKQILGLLGLGLDHQDEHKRLTQSDYFLLIGGSAETHERMQDTAIRFEEDLKRRGRRLQDASPEEVFEILKKAQGF